MKKILHTSRYTGIPWDILSSVVPEGFRVETLSVPDRAALLRQAADADYLLVSGRLRIDAEVLAAAPRLKMIQRTGVGTEMLDEAAIGARGIPVYVNAGVNARSVAEHTLSLMLACLKRLPAINAQVHSGVWKKQANGVTTRELGGKTVGLVGMGHIGRIVASLLKAFGAEVVYSDVVRQDVAGAVFCSSFEEMLPKVDILSFHCPLTAENTALLNGRTMALLQPGAIVVNTARGKLIDPLALRQGLLDGRIAAAGLDTHWEEPLPADYPLLGLDNVILTPHIGGLSREAFHSMMENAVGNIVAFDRGDLSSIEDKKLIF